MSAKKTMLECFQMEWEAAPSNWEREKFAAIARFDFSLTSGIVALPFSTGSAAFATFSGTEFADKKNKWRVIVEKNGIEFSLPATQFFKLFTA